MPKPKQYVNWNPHDPYSMYQFLLDSKMVLSDEEKRLVHRLMDPDNYRVSVYELHEMNMLCQQAIGWMRAKNTL